IAFPDRPAEDTTVRQPAAIVRGYPAFDADFVQYLLARHGVPTDNYEHQWLAAADYAKYRLVVLVGDLVRSKMTPNQYDATDLERIRQFLNGGGTLLVMRAGRQA